MQESQEVPSDRPIISLQIPDPPAFVYDPNCQRQTSLPRKFLEHPQPLSAITWVVVGPPAVLEYDLDDNLVVQDDIDREQTVTGQTIWLRAFPNGLLFRPDGAVR
jgi:hypothetical protein